MLSIGMAALPSLGLRSVASASRRGLRERHARDVDQVDRLAVGVAEKAGDMPLLGLDRAVLKASNRRGALRRHCRRGGAHVALPEDQLRLVGGLQVALVEG